MKKSTTPPPGPLRGVNRNEYLYGLEKAGRTDPDERDSNRLAYSALSLMYGKRLTTIEAGLAMGYSHGRITQLEQSAVRKIRQEMELELETWQKRGVA